VIVVGPRVDRPRARGERDRVVRGVRDGDAVRLPEGDPLDVAVEGPQDAAVGHHHDPAGGRLAGERLEGARDARVERAPALAPGNRVVGIDRAVAAEGAGIALADLVVREPLARAEMALAQPGIEPDGKPRGGGDGARGVVGAPEVARDEEVEGLCAREAPGDRFGLRAAGRGERAVALPLDALLEVPLRLAVADDDEVRQGFAFSIRVAPPMKGTRAFGTVTLPSAFW